MPSLRTLYTELTVNLKSYLLTEYGKTTRLPVARENYIHFVEEARNRRYRPETNTDTNTKIKQQQTSGKSLSKKLEKMPMPTEALSQQSTKPIQSVLPDQRTDSITSNQKSAITYTDASPPAAKTQSLSTTLPPKTKTPPQQAPQPASDSVPAPPSSPTANTHSNSSSNNSTEIDSFSSLFTLLPKELPSLKIFNTIPSDIKAKKIRFSWMLKEVAIGFISNSKGHTKDTEADKAEYSFLQTVSTGVSNRLAIARVYSSSFAELFGGWEPFIANIDTTLKLLVASKREIEDNPTLKAGYNNDTSNPQLFGYPLIFIEDYTFYINSPDNKRALWLQLQDSIKKND